MRIADAIGSHTLDDMQARPQARKTPSSPRCVAARGDRRSAGDRQRLPRASTRRTRRRASRTAPMQFDDEQIVIRRGRAGRSASTPTRSSPRPASPPTRSRPCGDAGADGGRCLMRLGARHVAPGRVEPTAPDDGLIWEAAPESAAPAGARRRVRGLERRRRRRHLRRRVAHPARRRHARVAHIDPEAHVDFQSRRPQVELVDGVTRSVMWPESTFYVARYPERDLVVLRGIEPSYRWKSFCRAVLDVSDGDGLRDGRDVRRAAGRRAPHPQGAGHRHGHRRRADRTLDLEPSRYEGPTGIVGVLHDECRVAAASRRCRCGRRCRTTSRRRRTRPRASPSSTGSAGWPSSTST